MNAERLLEHYERIADAPDAIPRLRRFVLDLAVRGKLVPQDPNDEPASELLKRIAQEKARLVKAGEIRKPKPLPAVDVPPFDLPQNWRWTRIREVASDRGQEVPQATFTYIDVSAIDKEAGVVANPQVLEASEAPSRARKITRRGDVIYSCVRPYLLNVAVIDTEFDPAPIASTAFAVLNGHGLVLPRYLWIVLRSPFMVESVEENQRGQAYPAINDADFAVLPFPLPPLAEQRRIVSKVDELMDLCDRLEAARQTREATRDKLTAASLARLNASDPETFADDARFALDALPALTARADQIKHLRQTILNLAVRGKLVPQDPSDEPASELLKDISQTRKKLYAEKRIPKPKELPSIDKLDLPFAMPSGWAWSMLGNLCYQVSDGPHFSPQYVPAEEGMPFLSARNIRLGSFDLSTVKHVSRADHEEFCKRIRPEKDDIIYTKGGTTGIAKVNDLDFEFSVWVHLAVLRIEKKRLYPRYVELALNSPHCYAQSQQYTQGTSNFDLGLTRMIKITVPLPPLAEQHRIVAKVDALLELCDRLEASLTATAATRRRLLDALLAEALAPADARELEAAE
ncbi:MAG: restriction endonuclease subunit S [Alphaproteobacteria bacterium]|nr:restriction endonuclease subunit S [Alphaproteobacteria bacterium]